MIIRIQYQGVSGSPWMREYMEGRIARLERYLSPTAQIIIDLISDSGKILTSFTVRTLRHEYCIKKDGDDLFEAFTAALEEAARILRRDHMRLREKMHRQIIDVTESESY